jgi:hypothetical protein
MSLRAIIGIFSALLRFAKCKGKLFEFHKFSFDISAPLPKAAVGTMDKGCSLLRKAGENFRITDGTALGIYRDGKFIDHDNDIDVDLLDCRNVFKLVLIFLYHGFSIGRFVYSHNNVQQIVFFDKSNIIFDIVFWRTAGSDAIENYSEPGFVRSQRKKYFVNKSEINFCGNTILLPGYIEEWLITRYGDDWSVPKKYKGDWKDDCHDIARL